MEKRYKTYTSNNGPTPTTVGTVEVYDDPLRINARAKARKLRATAALIEVPDKLTTIVHTLRVVGLHDQASKLLILANRISLAVDDMEVPDMNLDLGNIA